MGFYVKLVVDNYLTGCQRAILIDICSKRPRIKWSVKIGVETIRLLIRTWWRSIHCWSPVSAWCLDSNVQKSYLLNQVGFS